MTKRRDTPPVDAPTPWRTLLPGEVHEAEADAPAPPAPAPRPGFRIARKALHPGIDPAPGPAGAGAGGRPS